MFAHHLFDKPFHTIVANRGATSAEAQFGAEWLSEWMNEWMVVKSPRPGAPSTYISLGHERKNPEQRRVDQRGSPNKRLFSFIPIRKPPHQDRTRKSCTHRQTRPTCTTTRLEKNASHIAIRPFPIPFSVRSHAKGRRPPEVRITLLYLSVGRFLFARSTKRSHISRMRFHAPKILPIYMRSARPKPPK